ncbi:MAG TPA: GIY-YIG nuclease family protein [Patescibacteria group bacterium]|nr:GIY-YIG nuclease family protein [Patescibacteria group bacterium]
MTYTVYILRTSANTLYTGQTNDLEKRLTQHRKKNYESAKYLKAFNSFALVYTEECATKSEALKREWEIKQLPKSKKEALINGL